MEAVEKIINIESMILCGGDAPVKFYVCLKNATLAKQKRIVLEHHQLLDPEYCRTALSSHVYYFQPVSTKNWAQNINTIIHSKLENGSLPQLSNVTRIGQQSTQVWVFGSQVQFQPNGSPIPMDMITQHFSTINAIGSPVKQGKGDTFREYLASLKFATGSINHMNALCTVAAYLTQMHIAVVDRARLKMGMLTRPVYFVDSSCQAAMVTLRSISQFVNNFTFLHSSKSTEKIDEIILKSTLPILINDDNMPEEVIDYCHELSGQTNLTNNFAFMIATKGENLPDVCEARKGEILISYHHEDRTIAASNNYESITSQWKNAVENVPFLIRFGNSMNTPSFRASCCDWVTFIAKTLPGSCYERCGHYAILMAALELLGNLHGDWTKEDCQAHIKSYLNRDLLSDDLNINVSLLNEINHAANNAMIGEKRPLIKMVGKTNGHANATKVAKDNHGKIFYIRPNINNVTNVRPMLPKVQNGSDSIRSNSTDNTDDFSPTHILTDNNQSDTALNQTNISNLITSSLSLLKPTPTDSGIIITQSDLSPTRDKSMSQTPISFCSEQQHRIINTVIGHFIDNIPSGRDPKDFIRSSYRTRDSSDIYIALRLPVLRKLLDVNTRKAFRDILDLHGGQRQQTRFGSDSTSAQLIPRELCNSENLQRIDDLMRLRLEQKRFPNRMPMHSGLSLLTEQMNFNPLGRDQEINGKLLRLQDIIGDNMNVLERELENESRLLPGDGHLVDSERCSNSVQVKIEETSE